MVYLTLTDKSYPKKLAFAYLMDVQKEFVNELRKDFGEQCVLAIVEGRKHAVSATISGHSGNRLILAPTIMIRDTTRLFVADGHLK